MTPMPIQQYESANYHQRESDESRRVEHTNQTSPICPTDGLVCPLKHGLKVIFCDLLFST